MITAFLLLFAQVVSLQAALGQQDEPDSERDLVYLVYAGPYASSPASTFGHLYLAFADSADHVPSLWDVYTFNAETYDAGSFKYVATGISGGFLGRFERTKYLTKVQDYVIEEDRDLWIFELNLGHGQVSSLREALSYRLGHWQPYTFFKRNCAFYVQDLLNQFTDSIRSPFGITSPSSVVRDAISANIVGEVYFKPRMSVSLRSKAEVIGEDLQGIVKENSWEKALSEVVSKDELSAQQLSFLVLYFWWAQREAESRLPPHVENALEELRFKSVERRVAFDSKSEWIGQLATPGYFHPYSRVSSKVGTQRKNAFYSLAIRAGAYDLSDGGPTNSALNQLELFSADLRYDSVTQRVLLDRASLVSLIALIPNYWLSRQRSWSLELSGQRGGLQGADAFHTFAKYGTGITKMARKHLYVYSLFQLGINHAIHENILATSGIHSGWIWKPKRNLRMGGSMLLESQLVAFNKSHFSGSLWISIDLRPSFLLTTQVTQTSHYSRLEIGISRYL